MEIEKVVLIVQSAAPVVIAPDLEAWPASRHALANTWIKPVPVPPLRGGAGSIIV